MTFAPNQPIQSTHFLDLFGNLPLNQPYADLISCASKMGAIYGTGFGSYGYGQTQPPISIPTTGDHVTSDQWLGLWLIMQNVSAHTGMPVSGLPPQAQLAPGEIITATGYDWQSAAILLDSVRNQVDPQYQTVEAGIMSDRTTAWTTVIQHDFTADFGSEDAARFFFNTGSCVQITPRLTDAPDAHAQSWATMLTLLGTIQFKSTSTSQTGSGGVGGNTGYYDLTDTYQIIFQQFATGIYAANNIIVQARRSNYTGDRGANGSVIEFQVIFDDQFGTPGDPVQGTLTNTVTSLRANSEFVSVGAPIYATQLELDGGGGPVFYTFNQTINTTVEDYNLLSRAYAAGYDPGVGNVVPLYATVRITNTGRVRGLSTGFPAFIVPPLPNVQSIITIVVDPGGAIVGKGGAGGRGAPSGVCGCIAGTPGAPGGPALRLQYATTVLNYGVIGGGGGGGGGGGAECGYIWNASAGGGGGGAGFGEGGATDPCGVTLGRFGGTGGSGGLLNGGAGGSSGNGITAVGGRGGDIGQAGTAGQTINASGGAGGANGRGLQGVGFVVPGSSLGDLRGGSE